MVESISYLNIKPYETYTDGKARQTTLTSFENVLHKEEKGTVASKEQTDTEKTDTDKTAKIDDSAKQVVFVNPANGQKVIYEDVAKEAKKTAASSNITTADSMKTTKYDSIFKKAAKKYNVSESLLKGIAKAESNFNAKDVSSSGAMGVMQLMPETAKGLGVSNPYDPEENIMGGAKCIAQKIKEFNGDIRLALAAYNAGSGAVKRNGGIPSYCKSYVSKVLSYKKAFETAKSAS